MDKACVVCGSMFEAKTDRAKYCCKKCANHSRYRQTREQVKEYNGKLEKKLVELYKTGLRDKEIAEKIGRCTSWVQKARQKMEIPRQGIKEKKVPWKPQIRVCINCGSDFITKTDNQVFCSVLCQRRYMHQLYDIKRKRRIKKVYVDKITLEELYRKENGICYICGGKCDYNDYGYINGHKHVFGNYPSRDHIKPLIKGGLHSWDNVRLAHIRCNSSKGVAYGK